MMMSQNGIFAKAPHGAAAVLLVVVGATACAPESLENLDPQQSEEALYLKKNKRLFTENNSVVHVCFQGSGTTAQKLRIRDLIKNTWGRYSALKIEGFEDCPAMVQSSWVPWELISTTGCSSGHAAIGLGSRRNDCKACQPAGSCSACQITQDVTPDNCKLEVTALHEFGHAIGWAHEHQRPDAGNPCGDPVDTDGIGLTPLDHESIMDSCRDRNHDGVDDNNNPGLENPDTLSVGDIMGLQKIYGRKPAGSLVGMNNQCVDIPNNTAPPSGLQLQVYDCNRGANQVWSYSVLGRRLLGKNVTTDFTAMDVRGGLTASGTPVQMLAPASLPAPKQEWSFSNAEILGIGTMCVDLPAGQNRVQVFRCHGGANQRWDIVPQATPSTIRIRAAGTNTCIVAPAGAPNGTDLQVGPCTSGFDAAQVFTFTAFGEIQARSLCFDSEFSDITNGRTLQLFSCKGTAASQLPDKLNQQFTIRGALKSGLGTCVTTPFTNFASQQPLVMFTCPASLGPDFTWEYYPSP